MAAKSFKNTQLFSAEGLVAVITGGGSGLGSIMARALAQNGAAKVFILGRRLNKLQEVAKSIDESKVIPVECDATSKDSLETAVQHVKEQAGYINLLCLNHGILGQLDNALAPKEGKPQLTIQEVQKHFWEPSMDDFTEVYRTNISSVHFSAVAFLELLDLGNKKGDVKQTSQIIITSSIGGLHRSFHFAGLGYLTSKAAVTHLAKCLGAFLIQYKIRVNVLAPGIFPSEMTAGSFNVEDMHKEGFFSATVAPLTRSGREVEMAGTLLYLASEAGGYLSGSVQLIDGGRLGALPGTTY